MSSAPSTFAVVGDGWRAGFFHRAARSLPHLLRVTGVVTRSPESAARAARTHAVPGFARIDDLLAAERPDFVVVTVPRGAAPAVIADLVHRGIRVVTETPPADTLEDLRALWAAVGDSGLVHVAEQYPRYPGHAARRALIRRGCIGRPTSVHVSSTHDYHAVAIMRSLLGVGRGAVRVRAQRFDSVLVDPLTRDAWTDDPREKPAETVIATIDFGGAMGLYDFTSNQWHNPLRRRRLLVRGSRGEIDGDAVTWMPAERTVLTAEITRRQTGYDLDLDGYDTDHLSFGGDVLWRNRFPGTRMADEELAIADLLVDAGAWAREEGPGPYALADAAQDHAVALAVAEAVETGREAALGSEPWAHA